MSYSYVSLAPVVLEALVRHYFKRVERENRATNQLMQDEFLYHEAFIKAGSRDSTLLHWMSDFLTT